MKLEKMLETAKISCDRPYDRYFQEKIIERGLEYALEGRVKKLKCKNGHLACVVRGGNFYDVTVDFKKDDENVIEDANCTCEYMQDKNLYCKHIYAAVYKSQKDENLIKIKKQIKKFIKLNKIMLNTYRECVRKLCEIFGHKQAKPYAQRYFNLLSDYKENKKKAKVKTLNIMYYAKIFKNLADILEKAMDDTEKLGPICRKYSKYIEENKFTFGDFMSIMINGKVSQSRGKYSEKELSMFGLLEDEKEAIRSGMYEPENFDMDNMDEDNYYYDEDEH